MLGQILAQGNPPLKKRTQDGGSLASSKEHKIIVYSEKVIEGKAFLIQSNLPNAEEQLDLRGFLTHDARGRELLYYLLHTRTNQPIYFALSKTLCTQKRHCEFALKKSLITQSIQQGRDGDLMTGLFYKHQSAINQPEINVKELPADEVLIVIIRNEDSPMSAAEHSAKKNVILKTDPVSKNLFSILLDSEFLRGGPRYARQTL
ncbi:hypothetical protein D4L85_20410 [Chryseolinea soli]|uniref:Uncharacterized protein n=1 Tax=Chryseolinea soli TaxID=2321403 RepID=A0A385SS47_9BACT|nr:hypothetical protein D4L85_20410 [Chryseolinea soli]